jgi:cystathionine gamma-synthase
MDTQETNAIAIAQFLDAHPSVAKVYYTGLPQDPYYGLMKRQQSGPGAMLSFELKSDKDAAKLASSTQIFRLAASLGGVESLICQPSTMTHRGMSVDARMKAGISDSLLRLSIGIETQSDLIADLEQVLFIK